jgi:hypothetical protein
LDLYTAKQECASQRSTVYMSSKSPLYQHDDTIERAYASQRSTMCVPSILCFTYKVITNERPYGSEQSFCVYHQRCLRKRVMFPVQKMYIDKSTFAFQWSLCAYAHQLFASQCTIPLRNTGRRSNSLIHYYAYVINCVLNHDSLWQSDVSSRQDHITNLCVRPINDVSGLGYHYH